VTYTCPISAEICLEEMPASPFVAGSLSGHTVHYENDLASSSSIKRLGESGGLSVKLRAV
jgi:hypothetical protein